MRYCTLTYPMRVTIKHLYLGVTIISKNVHLLYSGTEIVCRTIGSDDEILDYGATTGAVYLELGWVG